MRHVLSFLSFLIRVTIWKALHVRGLYSIAEAWLNKLIRALAHAKHLDPLTHDSSSVQKTSFACRWFCFPKKDHATIPFRRAHWKDERAWKCSTLKDNTLLGIATCSVLGKQKIDRRKGPLDRPATLCRQQKVIKQRCCNPLNVSTVIIQR